MSQNIYFTSYWSTWPKSNRIFVEQIERRSLHQLQCKLPILQVSNKVIRPMILRQGQSNCSEFCSYMASKDAGYSLNFLFLEYCKFYGITWYFHRKLKNSPRCLNSDNDILLWIQSSNCCFEELLS